MAIIVILNKKMKVHLNEDEFQRVFNMTYAQFKEKPLWKQKELKRSVRLF